MEASGAGCDAAKDLKFKIQLVCKSLDRLELVQATPCRYASPIASIVIELVVSVSGMSDANELLREFALEEAAEVGRDRPPARFGFFA